MSLFELLSLGKTTSCCRRRLKLALYLSTIILEILRPKLTFKVTCSMRKRLSKSLSERNLSNEKAQGEETIQRESTRRGNHNSKQRSVVWAKTSWAREDIYHCRTHFKLVLYLCTIILEILRAKLNFEVTFSMRKRLSKSLSEKTESSHLSQREGTRRGNHTTRKHEMNPQLKTMKHA